MSDKSVDNLLRTLLIHLGCGHSLLLRTVSGEPFDLLAAVTSLRRVGVAKSWSAQVVVDGDNAQPSRAVAGRVCALRKSAAAIKLAHRKVRKEATRKGKQAQPDTLRFAEYVIVFTTFPAAAPAASNRRCRWCGWSASGTPSRGRWLSRHAVVCLSYRVTSTIAALRWRRLMRSRNDYTTIIKLALMPPKMGAPGNLRVGILL